MNCKQVEELMPLYVGHDLEDESTGRIAAHLQTCTACAGSAREYEQANQLLQQFEPPQFSDAAYAAVRHSVLREIEKESRALTLRELLLRPFQPRFMWAVSTAVLLVVCAFAYYFIANRTSGTQNKPQVADLPGNAGGSPALATSSPNSQLNLPIQGETAGGRDLRAVAAVPDSPKLGTSSRKPRLNMKTHIAWRSRKGSEPPAFPSVEPDALNTSVTSDKSLRLEMQTKDPNIRIIWFSHPSANEGSPNESSKGI